MTKRRVRVLVVVGTLDVGGAEMDILRNMPRIDRERFDVRVFAFLGPGQLGARLVAEGIELIVPASAGKHEIQKPREGSRRRSFTGFRLHLPGWAHAVLHRCFIAADYARLLSRFVPPIAWYVLTRRIRIVHCFLPHAYIAGGLASVPVPGCRLMMSRLSSNFYMDKWPIYRTVETRVLHRFARLVLCNAEPVRRELIAEGVPADRILTLRNGIDIAGFTVTPERRAAARRSIQAPDGQFTMTVVANLFAYKGHDDLIDALAAVRSCLPQGWRVLCAGRDEDNRRALLEAQVTRLGLAGNVSFLGPLDDIPSLLAASDLHLHPSREDALPNSILEAMASGLAIVGTTVGGVPDLIEHGRGGLLVPPGEPGALGAAIARLAGDPAARRRMGAINAEKVEQEYSIARSVAAYEAAYTLVDRGLTIAPAIRKQRA